MQITSYDSDELTTTGGNLFKKKSTLFFIPLLFGWAYQASYSSEHEDRWETLSRSILRAGVNGS